MKTLLSIICCVWLVSCAAPVAPIPTPSPPVDSSVVWRVEERDDSGNLLKNYYTKQYHHRYYPREITFNTLQGEPVKLTKNFSVWKQ